MDENRIVELFKNYQAKPQYIEVNSQNMELFLSKSPGGGNSHQRRKWRRAWTKKRVHRQTS